MKDRNKIVKEFLESDNTHLLFYEGEKGETLSKAMKESPCSSCDCFEYSLIYPSFCDGCQVMIVDTKQ